MPAPWEMGMDLKNDSEWGDTKRGGRPGTLAERCVGKNCSLVYFVSFGVCVGGGDPFLRLEVMVRKAS